MKEEIWRPIKGYEGLYEISSEGRVKRLMRTRQATTPTGKPVNQTYQEKILKPWFNCKYPWVSLCKEGLVLGFSIHRLVAEAYLPNPQNKPQVNHKDLNKKNSSVDNLEWCTPSENAQHAHNNGARNCKGQLNGRSKLTPNDVIGIRSKYKNKNDANWLSKEYKVSEAHVHAIANRRFWTHI